MTPVDAVQSALHQHNADRSTPGDPPGTLAELLSRHAPAAVALSGAGQTAWNGQIVEAGDGILGLAHWDGTLHLDRECILDPLHDLYARAGRPRPQAVLAGYRDALVTLLHEQSHFLGPQGATQEAARLAFREPGSRALEEGVAEAWSHSHLNAYLHSLGIPEVAPGIDRITTQPSYQAFLPATVLLTSHLDHRAALPPGRTLHLLNRQTAEGQWPLVTDLVYRSSELPHRVPPAQEPEVRHHLESFLRTAFHSLDPLQRLPHGLAAHRSRTLMRATLSTLEQELTRLTQAFPPHATVHQKPRAQASATGPAKAPARWTDPRSSPPVALRPGPTPARRQRLVEAPSRPLTRDPDDGLELSR
ncbi:hypothetical protein Kfla_7024 [Kribbella flavida DSM 17836]|uniref:Uncharacterized protein n=1 Tax=Kribbella flavida (strain DSM 17836 / JCM 10339 / NBRC 14399) TaxID=479435 RepID=D2Q3Z0_KRIFD|nr:hypothetical protein [Kribbella flavida]ADB36012.1 hypothetical protein Kfla_7024 [Kribbella flavida DSM 17836]